MTNLSPHSSSPGAPQPNHRYPTPTQSRSTRPLLWRLYLSHTLSTWNARTFEFGAVIFLATIFPGTLFFASCYALFRSAAAAVLGSWIGDQVDRNDRLVVVRQSIVWQRLSVAGSCVILIRMLNANMEEKSLMYTLFAASVVLACVEKLGSVANTVSIERDWIIVVSDSLHLDRQELNSTMRRIDLVCKLIAPVGIGLLDGYSTRVAIWVVFGQKAMSVLIEYFAIVQVYKAVLNLAHKREQSPEVQEEQRGLDSSTPRPITTIITNTLRPYKEYIQNPAFLASFSLSLLYLTVLSFASQMTTYLLTLGFTSTDVSIMRLVSVALELSATCVAPWLMHRIGAVRSGLWFVNEQLISIALAVGLFSLANVKSKLAGGALVLGVCLSRLGLWGFDLSVQYLVQEDAPSATRGSFSAIEMSIQNLFELLSFATTMIFYRPEDFRIPIYISAGAVATSAACFAGFMSSMRNAVQRRNHKERAQPVERQKWGLLEKAKDYKLRAADHRGKKAKLKILSQKARDRNPDEFSFKMMSSKVDKQGRKVADRGDKVLSLEVVKLLKTQDAGYIRTMLQMARKEREELEERLILEEQGEVRALRDGDKAKKGKHRVFVENEEEQEEFDPEAWFGRGQDLPGREDPSHAEDLDADLSDDDDKNDAPQTKTMSKKKLEAQELAKKEARKFRKDRERAQSRTAIKLASIKKREKELAAAEEELDAQRARMNNTVGGVNKHGVKFKIRERKR
ncbi:Utp11-domain-containing protein [Cucurbitaria berberidis CBS 394.84]|uniref:Utp11-domain-containing protein n=1 Tax=Cucurbitaria berberidis CBS 394.84 TaxID=1168544 RepID=A0A9P4GTQ4_9PLEO|nr:Utp11-domain-containing protein [Cucurbitaria berberidis CBS 394.84]KAF1851565.1 Utp11-domain-containing protein [Cucurbitaria berberidis CBS 394.84]